MQKWEKFLLISLFILAILGGLIGFAITESGIGEMKVLTNIDVSSLLALILLTIVITCAIFDTYETFESQKQFGTAKFEVTLNTRNRFRNVLIFLALVTIFEFGAFLYSIDIEILPSLFITLILNLIFAFHSMINNAIGENGILHWGIYHSWNDIKSHNIENENLLEMNVINNFFCFEYNCVIKFDFDEKDKEDIEKFLVDKLCGMDNQTDT